MGDICEYDGVLPTTDERIQKIHAWEKQTWLDFCKMVMESDKRFTILPMFMFIEGNPMTCLTNDEGVFGRQCLKRDGILADVYIIPMERGLGMEIKAGSKYTSMRFNGFPSKTMLWPVLKIADELERQFVREVAIESSKHGNTLQNSNRRKQA